MCFWEPNLSLRTRPLAGQFTEAEDVLVWEFGGLGSEGRADGEGVGARLGRLNWTRGLMLSQLHRKNQ